MPTTRNIKLTIEYDGTDFNGWQIQKKEFRTVQSEIKSILEKILGEKIILFGSGRTDSGVHALGQVANFKTTSSLDCKQLLKALNHNLADDIAIHKVEEVPLDFHAQFSAKSKIYRYTILNRSTPTAHLRNFVYFFPHKINFNAFKHEIKLLTGKKNFKSFQSSPSDDRGKKINTVRTVKKISVRKKQDFIYIDIEADGFLYKMVRNIIGTLLDVASGRLEKGSIKKILAKENRIAASKPADARGLCLLEVKY